MFGKVLRDPADREHAVLPALAVRRREGLRPLHHGQLPRVLRPARDERDPVQPRVHPSPTRRCWSVENGLVYVLTAADLVPLQQKGRSVQSFAPAGVTEVWDGDDWTPFWRSPPPPAPRDDPDHQLRSHRDPWRRGHVTAHHHMLDDDYEQVVAARRRGGRPPRAFDERLPADAEWTSLSRRARRAARAARRRRQRQRAHGHAPTSPTTTASCAPAWPQLWSRCFLGTSTEQRAAVGLRPDPVRRPASL